MNLKDFDKKLETLQMRLGRQDAMIEEAQMNNAKPEAIMRMNEKAGYLEDAIASLPELQQEWGELDALCRELAVVITQLQANGRFSNSKPIYESKGIHEMRMRTIEQIVLKM